MKKILIVLVILLLTGCSNTISSGSITCKEKDTLMKEDNTILIDVRTKEEYESGHLENAINIPVDIVLSKIGEYASKDTKIIIYCQSGKRATTAFETLKNNGYKNIYNLGSINSCK